MLKDLKMGFQLMKYGYRIKMNVIFMLVILVIGIIVEITSEGTSFLGGFYLMLTGMFAYQLIMSMDISEMVQTSAMKRRLQVELPVVASTVVYLAAYTFLLVERVILIYQNPQGKEEPLYTLFTIVLMMVTIYIFTAICYKYFVAGFILFLILFIGVDTGAVILWNNGIGAWLCQIGLGWLAVLGYAVVLLGGGIEYLLGSLLYRKPLSEFAFRGIFKDAK
uniref:hypothetical protein n=1 Tax=Roseburia sp. TaxID=2049040 RepID=UPI003FEE7DA3